MQLASQKTKIPAVAGVSLPYRLYMKVNVQLSVSENKQFLESLQSRTRSGDVVVPNARISARI